MYSTLPTATYKPSTRYILCVPNDTLDSLYFADGNLSSTFVFDKYMRRFYNNLRQNDIAL